MQEVFEKIIEKLEERTDFLSDCTKYGNKDAKQQNKSYSTMMMYEAADLVDDLIEIVKQEASEYNNGWIPVSEQLPEKYGDYLVAWKPLHMSAEDIIKKVGREVPHFYEIVEYDPDDEALWIGSIEQAQGEYEIIAWQPLPEPYQPKGE